jgi:soluble lytic murein transglycosylase
MNKKYLIFYVVFLLIGVFVIPKVISKIRLNTAKKVISQWKALAEQYAKYWSIDSSIVLAIICQESGGDPNAVNPSDPSRGLMAITQGALTDFNKAVGRSYTFNDLFTPYINVEVGTWYISHQMKHTATLTNALAAYNAGLGNISAGQKYSSSVTEYLSAVKQTLTA